MFSASSIRTAMAFAAVLRAGLLAVPPRLSASSPPPFFATSSYARVPRLTAAARAVRYRRRSRPSRAAAAITASLDLTEDNVRLALEEAKSEARKLNRFPSPQIPPMDMPLQPRANAVAGLVRFSLGSCSTRRWESQVKRLSYAAVPIESRSCVAIVIVTSPFGELFRWWLQGRSISRSWTVRS